MFRKRPDGEKQAAAHSGNSNRRRIAWDIPIFFGIIFALSIAELCFTIDAFIYLNKLHKWYSKTEKGRMGFLIFSCVRTIFLSGTYAAAHFFYVKNLMNTLHLIFLIMSAIFWVISGVLIYQMWSYMECNNAGIPTSFGQFKSLVSGGISLCHEIKTIEILAWVIAAVSVIATIPVIMTYMKMKRQKRARVDGINNEKNGTV
ncbi:hypothetical protein CPB83DRAFT_844455 [Crepidotus variabilis]|uniref:Uncharacterized protein n=1 Tax=Crepidotus variabilis TaxID=179855 RepID=A0A9P6JVS3_9AGAR|nr:hypothetical protein CPB83DRAFT_844455 [Crepidotus variabilis]